MPLPPPEREIVSIESKDNLTEVNTEIKSEERVKTEVCLIEEGKGKEEELQLPVWEEDIRREGGATV